ncbi:MlaD family protein [Antrihabitans sp. YC2-6]|uniref:MlaD family protein n=1 Tax=Antrihabitans sp. YC2-6 TaxID=2799498 RepID=UPI0018F30EE2|nr:MlaD family protein [Antrihabitans sp. YC2-6]MBJ8347227.1 MCE family protein [Antrihabitans sp. YC2-6]
MTALSKKLALATTIATTLSATACAAGLQSLPLPAPGVEGDTYELQATFANALNLPAKAKVRLFGADVGEVTSMTAVDYSAVVQLRIDAAVHLPVGTTAELRSATPLGDVFVAVRPPNDVPPATPILADGDAIPIESTSAAATIEQVLSALSLVVNGGAVRNLTKILNGAGTVVDGSGGNLGELIDDATRLISTLSSRSEDIAAALERTAELTATIGAQQDSVHAALAAAAPALKAVADNSAGMTDLAVLVDHVATQLSTFPSLAGTDSRSTVDDLNTLSSALNAVSVDPRTSLGAIGNILGPVVKMLSSTAGHADLDVRQFVAGVVPDPNSPGDPGSRLPEVGDLSAAAGTLTYTLLKLRDRVLGPPR